MRWVIDANIIFDFDAADLLDELFRLPFTYLTTDLVMREIVRPPAEEIVRRGVQVHSPETTELILALSPKLSLSDVSAFVLAQSLGVGLLTGDSRLRALAAEHAVPVHGTLWLMATWISRASPARSGTCVLPAVVCPSARLTRFSGVCAGYRRPRLAAQSTPLLARINLLRV